MSEFIYKAITSDNKVIEDVIDAQSHENVVDRLRNSGLVPVEVRRNYPGSSSAWWRKFRNGFRRGRRRIGDKEVRAITEQFSNLVSAGLPIDRALHSMARTASGPVAELLLDLHNLVRGGASLSEALGAHEDVFAPSDVRIVQAGEIGGTLADNLGRISEDLDRRAQLRGRIVSALVYPSVLLVLATLSLVVLLVFVVPRFVPVFESSGVPLPLLTRMVLGIADAGKSYGWIVVVLAIAGLPVARRLISGKRVRETKGRLLLQTPLIGALVRDMEVSRFARTLGVLLQNGVGLLAALSLAEGVLRNHVIADAVSRGRERVKAGTHLSSALSDSDAFTVSDLQLIQVGEATGSLARMLLRVAELRERESRLLIDRLMALLVPVLTLCLAAIIGVIVASMLIPILNMSRLLV